ncbi:DUF6531 domain-containing protein [Zooshikella ganghwensis]|uniref:DUF6531 domain-containing protein n=1 Tax=Zooshikella ganghwensis TaxID=202772 RepID=UPI000685587C|nr:DUF6531 domain-containing protein [Zooshikella ganghwensis]
MSLNYVQARMNVEHEPAESTIEGISWNADFSKLNVVRQTEEQAFQKTCKIIEEEILPRQGIYNYQLIGCEKASWPIRQGSNTWYVKTKLKYYIKSRSYEPFLSTKMDKKDFTTQKAKSFCQQSITKLRANYTGSTKVADKYRCETEKLGQSEVQVSVIAYILSPSRKSHGYWGKDIIGYNCPNNNYPYGPKKVSSKYFCFRQKLSLSKQLGPADCTSPSTGNPIRISTGNKYQQELDLDEPIAFSRFYNSETGLWTHSFDYKISPSLNRNIYTLIRPSGKSFLARKVGGRWETETDENISIKRNPQQEWIITSNQQEELYDKHGTLTQIKILDGSVIHVSWNDKTQTLKDLQGNELTLIYNAQNQLVQARLNNSQTVSYTYGPEGHLTNVTNSASKSRQYHYENGQFPYHLTGITDGNGKRFATWTYDDKGRAISSEHAGGSEKTSLEYHANNSTTVTNPLGKKTTYHFKVFNGSHKVVKVEGQQTEHCAAANKEYTYYNNGLLKSKTDWKGMVTAFEYNDRGLETKRTVAVGTPSQYEVVTEWHDTLRLPTAKITRGERVEYHYDEHGRLIKKDN